MLFALILYVNFLAHLSTKCSKVSFCDRWMSVVCKLLACVDNTGLSFHPIFMKFGQNVCLDKI